MTLTADQSNLITIAIGLLTAIGFFLLGLTAKRPKLIGGGGGSSSVRVPDKDVMATHISVRNQPTYWGIKIHREAANITSARLFDPDLKEVVGPALKWQIAGTTGLSPTTKIDSGKVANLYVFGKERHADEYFVYDASALDSALSTYLTRYREPKKHFSIIVYDDIGRKHRFDVAVRNSNQSVSISFKITFRTRLAMIGEGMGLIIRAFSLRN